MCRVTDRIRRPIGQWLFPERASVYIADCDPENAAWKLEERRPDVIACTCMHYRDVICGYDWMRTIREGTHARYLINLRETGSPCIYSYVNKLCDNSKYGAELGWRKWRGWTDELGQMSWVPHAELSDKDDGRRDSCTWSPSHIRVVHGWSDMDLRVEWTRVSVGPANRVTRENGHLSDYIHFLYLEYDIFIVK